MIDALAQLERSHRRLEEVLDALEEARRGGLEPSQRVMEALDDATRYFTRAAPRHERDEEESLFPRMPEGAGALIARLTAEHRAQHELHARLVAAVEGFERDSDAGRAELGAVITQLDAAYRAHIALEDAELLPSARAHLCDADHEAIAREMDERRGGGGGGRGCGGRGR